MRTVRNVFLLLFVLAYFKVALYCLMGWMVWVLVVRPFD